MSTINKYETLKSDGTWTDRIKYVLSLPDKSEIEKYLKESSSYDDLQMLLCLSKSMKNEKNILDLFKNDSYPVKQRALAAKSWLQLQKDEKQIHQFIVETLKNRTIPRFLKYDIFRNIHQTICSRKPTFFYDLLCDLTKTFSHEQFNIDAYLLPFCSKDQIFELLSRWSIKRFEQIHSSSLLRTKLLCYQPLVVIDLIKQDINDKIGNKEKLEKYFRDNEALLELLVEKETKAMFNLAMEYVNQLEKHKKMLPGFIHSKQKIFFKKLPDDMIELITIVASNKPGTIKAQTSYDYEGSNMNSFVLPRSFSVNNYVDLFFALYDKCNWSSHHTNNLLEYMLMERNSRVTLNDIKKERKWLYDITIEKRIGKELFIKKLLEENSNFSFNFLNEYSDIITPIINDFISKSERKEVLDANRRLSLIVHQPMTQEIYNQFLSLFKQISSDADQRSTAYRYFFKSALLAGEEMTKNVLEWIKKRFTNEQLHIIESFLSDLTNYNDKCHLEILPKNYEAIETIMDIAINHLEQTTSTLNIIYSYAIFLLKRAEHYSNRKPIQEFACKIIKKCISIDHQISAYNVSFDESYPEARRLITNIFLSDLFPKLLSKYMLVNIMNILETYLIKSWLIPEVDSFINSFFMDKLPSSKQLQTRFKTKQNSSIISMFLKNRSTRFQRVDYLINKLNKSFLIDENVQRIVLRSQQHRQLIDQLIQDEKCLTMEKLSSESTISILFEDPNFILPAFSINILNYNYRQLTGKQQEHITKIILYDYIKNNDVKNFDKLKALRILRRLTHTYDETLQFIENKENNSTEETTIDKKTEALYDVIICLPASFDLNQQNLLKQFHFLAKKLNATNAKYISTAMSNILHKIPDDIFLKHYVEIIRDENFQKLGITANKSTLRLLKYYTSESNLLSTIVKPLWDSKPHQDVRACLILTLLHFIGKLNTTNDESTLWKILDDATQDEYLPVTKNLFNSPRAEFCWPLIRLKTTSDKLFERFVNEIQLKVLDHPSSLEARSHAWSNIEHEHCDTKKLIEKAQQISIQFNKDSNNLWAAAFEKIILMGKQNQTLTLNVIIDMIKKLMSSREEIDSKENAIDNQHDLPVYHRINDILNNLNSHINEYDNNNKSIFRSFILDILQSEKTFVFSIGTILFKIAQNKEDIENILTFFQNNLSSLDFQDIIIEFSRIFSNQNSCPFIQQLNVKEKFDLAQWFIQTKNQPLFVFDFLTNHVFNAVDVDREQAQNLLRQLRQNERLIVRQKAMEFVAPWREVGEDDDRMNESSDESGSSMS